MPWISGAIIGGSLLAGQGIGMLAGGGDFSAPGPSGFESRLMEIWPRIMRQLEEEFDDINRAVTFAREQHLMALNDFHRRMGIFDQATAAYNAAIEKYTPEISPDVERTIEEERKILNERILRGLGPGGESSTPGIQALAEFGDAAARARFTARKSAELTKLDLLGNAMNINQYAMTLPQQLFGLASGGVDIEIPAMNAALAKGGLISQPLGVFGGIRQQQQGQANLFNTQQSAALMNQLGQGIGRFGSGAAAGQMGLFGPNVGALGGGTLGVSGLASPFLIQQGLLGRGGGGLGGLGGGALVAPGASNPEWFWPSLLR